MLTWFTVAQAQDVTFDAVTRVEYGRDEPSITVRSQVDGKLTVNLSCGGRSFDRTTRVAPAARPSSP